MVGALVPVAAGAERLQVVRSGVAAVGARNQVIHVLGGCAASPASPAVAGEYLLAQLAPHRWCDAAALRRWLPARLPNATARVASRPRFGSTLHLRLRSSAVRAHDS